MQVRLQASAGPARARRTGRPRPCMPQQDSVTLQPWLEAYAGPARTLRTGRPGPCRPRKKSVSWQPQLEIAAGASRVLLHGLLGPDRLAHSAAAARCLCRGGSKTAERSTRPRQTSSGSVAPRRRLEVAAGAAGSRRNGLPGPGGFRAASPVVAARGRCRVNVGYAGHVYPARTDLVASRRRLEVAAGAAPGRRTGRPGPCGRRATRSFGGGGWGPWQERLGLAGPVVPAPSDSVASRRWLEVAAVAAGARRNGLPGSGGLRPPRSLPWRLLGVAAGVAGARRNGLPGSGGPRPPRSLRGGG